MQQTFSSQEQRGAREPRASGMSAQKAVLIGCGIALGLGLLFLVLVFVGFVYVIGDPPGVNAHVDVPLDVRVGATLDLVVTVTNVRSGKGLSLSSIDLSDEYLAGFTVLQVDPPAQSSMHIPLDNSQSFTFDAQVPPGESRQFTFSLRAEKPGIYRGDVDVCEGARFVTTMAQTVVRE